MSELDDNLVKEVRRLPEGTVVRLAGEVDLHHSPALHAALVDVASERPRRLIVVLSDVPYMDSSGVGTLVEVFRRVSAYKGKMILVGMSPRVRSIFEITKLDKFFSICNDVDQAIQV